jgi:hypothetical protein
VPEDPCLVNQAVSAALRDAGEAYAARGVLVVPSLEARARLATHDRLLYSSIYTIFRGLPARLAPGTTLYVSTTDRAGGDVELAWEAREDPSAAPVTPEPDPRVLLGAGPYGDLLEVAMHGLDAFCRVRAAASERADAPRGLSATALDLSPKVRRRFSFLIPSLERGGWADQRADDARR